VGALRALREAGRRVPDDVAVVGFDDAPIASLALPPLTTIRQPIDTMTSVAADLLVSRLGNGAGEPEHIVCATTFVPRASSEVSGSSSASSLVTRQARSSPQARP